MGEQNHAHNLNRLYLLSYYGYDPVPPLDLTPDNPKDRKDLKSLYKVLVLNAPEALVIFSNHFSENDDNAGSSFALFSSLLSGRKIYAKSRSMLQTR